MKDRKIKKLFEFESVGNGKDLPYASHVILLNQLHKRIETELVPNISKKFTVDYEKGEEINLKTKNDDDLSVNIKRKSDIISINISPVVGIDYEFNYTLNDNGVESSFNTIKFELDKPEQGLKPIPTGKYKMSDKEADDHDLEILSTPITKKPVRRKRSININIIRDVLEDAFILDDIDLLNTDVDELIRRMLLESRRSSK